MIRKIFLLALPLFLFTTQQIQAVEKDPVLEEMAQRRAKTMEILKKEGRLPQEINKARLID